MIPSGLPDCRRPTFEPSPEADPLTVRALQRLCFKPRSAAASPPSVSYAVRLGHGPGTSSSWKEAKPHTIGIYSDVKRFSTRKKAEDFMAKSTGPGDRYSRTQPLSCSPMVLHFPTARQAGEFTSLSLAQMRLKRFGDWLSRPLPAPPGLVPCGPPATQGNLAPSTKPSLGSGGGASLYPWKPTQVTILSPTERPFYKALCHPLHQTRGQQASHRPDHCLPGPSQKE